MPLVFPCYSNQSFADGRWVTVDLHIHSVYSGGMMVPREVLENAGQHLLDAIAISDHYEIKGAVEGREFNRESIGSPLMIISQEVSAGDHFHLLIVGSNQIWPETNRYNLLEQIGEHHRNGGAVILAHPWSLPKAAWVQEYLKTLIAEGWLDGIEVFNSSISELDHEGLAALKDFWEEWVVPNQLGIFGGSDFHHLRKGRLIGTGKTYLKVYQPGEAGIVQAIREHRAVAGLNSHRQLDLDWLGSGFHFICGLDPWYTEVIELTNFLKNHIISYFHFDPLLQSFLLKLIINGQFQHLYDLLF